MLVKVFRPSSNRNWPEPDPKREYMFFVFFYRTLTLLFVPNSPRLYLLALNILWQCYLTAFFRNFQDSSQHLGRSFSSAFKLTSSKICAHRHMCKQNIYSLCNVKKLMYRNSVVPASSARASTVKPEPHFSVT